MTHFRFLMRAKSINMRVEVRLNDIPVATFGPGEAVDGAEVPLNEFLVANDNVVTAIVNASRPPSRVAEPRGGSPEPGVSPGAPALLELEILRMDGAVADPGFTPVQLAWRGVETPRPQVEQCQFDGGSEIPKWAWTQARELQVRDMQTAMRGLKEIWAMLDRKDTKSLERVLALKLDEVSAAYAASAARFRDGFVQAMNRVFREDGWRLLPCQEKDVDLRLVGRRRLVECLRPDGRHALMFVKQNSTETFFIPVKMGDSGGRWQVLR